MDISNKTLALFLVAAIILSLGGTIISLNRLSRISGPTGLVSSQTGVVNVTIKSMNDITVYNATVYFGQGIVSQSCALSFATLSNNGSGTNQGNCWVNNSGGSAVAAEGSKIQIQNDGNVNVSLTMTSMARNYSNFIGNCTAEDHNWYRYATQNNESSSCVATNLQGGWTNVSSSSMSLCSMLDWTDTKDSIAIIFNISICKTVFPSGDKNDTLTITAAAA